MSLAAFQNAFAEALLTIDQDEDALKNIPHLPQSSMLKKQLAVYRAKSLKGLRRMLVTTYPTIEKILGPDAFQFTSDSYFLDQPPQAVEPIIFCENFASYLEPLEITKELPHLPDIATIDLGCFHSRQAVDSPSVETHVFTDLSPEQLATKRVQLHPSCFWMSSHFAVYDLWQSYNTNGALVDFKKSAAQEVVILRHGIHTVVVKADAGLVKTMDALDEGHPLSSALQQGSQAYASFNPVSAIQFLIKNKLVVNLY